MATNPDSLLLPSSDPSRYVNSLVASYALTAREAVSPSQPDGGPDILPTILSALYGHKEHDKRFRIFGKSYISSLRLKSRSDLLQEYVKHCHPPSGCRSILAPVQRYVFFKHVIAAGSDECFVFLCDLIFGEKRYQREVLWLLQHMTRQFITASPEGIAKARKLADEISSKNTSPVLLSASALFKSFVEKVVISSELPTQDFSLVLTDDDNLCPSCGFLHPQLFDSPDPAFS